MSADENIGVATDTAANLYDLTPILSQQTPKAPPVTEFDSQLSDLSRELLDFAQKCETPKLAGLAANQLANHGERLMVNMCVVMNEKEEWVIAVNPEVYQHTGNQIWSNEGCLTWPNKVVEAQRYENVSIRYQDLEGKQLFHGATGFEAIVWQHEINHLQGVNEKVVNPKTGKVYGNSVDGGGTVVNDKKVGRNEPCPCGSGSKYKKCCGK